MNISKPNIKMTDNVNNNLDKIVRKYGRRFKIHYRQFEIPVILEKTINNYINYYEMYYDMKERTHWLLPLYIKFIDISPCENTHTNKIDDNITTCYISNVHRTSTITGTQMMEIIIKLLEIIGIKTIKIYDDAHINCKTKKETIDLTLFKLIEKQRGFYEKFGFEYDFSCPKKELLYEIGTRERAKYILSKSIYFLQNNSVEDILYNYRKFIDLMRYIKKIKDYKTARLIIKFRKGLIIYSPDENSIKFRSILKDLTNLIRLLIKYKKMTIQDAIIKMFYTNCESYLNLIMYTADMELRGIKYKNKLVKLKLPIILDELHTIRHISLIKKL